LTGLVRSGRLGAGCSLNVLLRRKRNGRRNDVQLIVSLDGGRGRISPRPSALKFENSDLRQKNILDLEISIADLS